jgi:nitroreductase
MQDKVREVLGIPSTAKAIEVMVLGYASDRFRPKTRKPAEEVVCFERFS